MTKSLIRIGVLSAFTLFSAAAFAENPPRNDDPNGAAMDRTNDQSPSAKKQTGTIQTQTDPKKNGTNQSEDVNGGKKNGQPQ
jgi:hypothetical protein